MFGIGETEFVIILVFGFMLFGPDKLPGMGRTIGRALRQFREAQEGFTEVVQSEVMDPLNKAMSEPLSGDARRRAAEKSAAFDEDSDLDGDGAHRERTTETFAERRSRLERERKEREARKGEGSAKASGASAVGGGATGAGPDAEAVADPAGSDAPASTDAPVGTGVDGRVPAAATGPSSPGTAKEARPDISAAALYAMRPVRGEAVEAPADPSPGEAADPTADASAMGEE